MTLEIDQQKAEIITVLNKYPEGLSRSQVSVKLSFYINEKTLQRRLIALFHERRITRKGERKGTHYYPLQASIETDKRHLKDKLTSIFSLKCQKKLEFLDTPLHQREKVIYNRDFLDSYVPNQSTYVPKKRRETLFQEGKCFDGPLATGTYAREISQRLLIDLSYNSSRLEGNTYSRRDTQKLIEEGISAKGKVHWETVMIMNHKEAILFLVESARDIELNSLTIRNLHHLLSQDLLANPEACGNTRTIEVSIGQSTYKPPDNPHVLKELFELIFLKAKKIKDPFEQSFFLLVHLSYLQAFEDVNKRTSRLSCNIPFIKRTLCPISFIDVARDDYTAALLTIYEKNDVEPLLELFAWTYSRSCKQYGEIKKSLREIDAFRIRYRHQRKAIMGQIVKRGLHGTATEALIEHYCRQHKIKDIDKFTAIALADLSALHAGAINSLGITEAQFNTWLSGKP